MQAYLAKNYLSGDAPTQNKKKKPKKVANATTRVVDEEVDDWKTRKPSGADEDVDETAPIIVDDAPIQDSPFKSSNWKRIQGNDDNDDEEEAQAALDARQSGRYEEDDAEDDRPRKRRRRHSSDDEQEDIRSNHRTASSPDSNRGRRRRDSSTPPPTSSHNKAKMSDGTSAGLQTSAMVKADLDKAKREQDAQLAQLGNRGGRDAETIYRDKTGRKVDVVAERAELLAQRRKRELEEEKQMEWGRGLAQTREKEEESKRLEIERHAPLAVYKDDVGYNETLKQRDRWGDPMAGLVKKPVAGKKEYPKYKGPWAPNRFGIPPGYRWDGVDRGTGFENKLFLSKNSKGATVDAAYKWSTESMQDELKFKNFSKNPFAFSHATIDRDYVFMCGQLAMKDGKFSQGTIQHETTTAMDMFGADLKELGLSFADVVKLNLFVTCLKNPAEALYLVLRTEKCFEEGKAPSSTIVGGKIEIDLTARIPKGHKL
ncbi:hypothetical protein SmJEL517_g02237 [Synchytrium microbalum]|uniref:Pre-mRNA-splicing factor CWC26 n=1 Tax=Synchytrium microbalum TaxID=1806994 RepID=A0A507C7H0_9FUNG|nr:uncharacterized protein SmJEL517_g02237 [Synchytrium microbalum]TPX35278.1 hypothetical protein SmJEL517_g02237 [Synchytrium microbalum]